MTQMWAERIGAAIDLGSTTIALKCFDMDTKNEIGETSFANPQYRYGADIITRIQHCMKDASMENKLQELVWEALELHIKNLLGADAVKNLELLVICGNTAMQHILRNLSLKGLASAPFHAVDLEEARESVVFDGQHITVLYPPGLSPFVGADLLAGAAHLQMGQTQHFDLLVDLGTNGEIILLNNKAGYASSTACGPVFDHALSGAAYGSESIHAIANCVKRKLIDENGVIAEPFFEKGIVIDKDFVIRQQNVRNFQLAKSAIYAGICCLATEAGIRMEEIGNVYISGGLGFYMDVKDAFTVGLLPDALREKTIISGNSSLEGAIGFLFEPERMEKNCEELKKRIQCYELSQMPQFETLYIKSLNF